MFFKKLNPSFTDEKVAALRGKVTCSHPQNKLMVELELKSRPKTT